MQIMQTMVEGSYPAAGLTMVIDCGVTELSAELQTRLRMMATTYLYTVHQVCGWRDICLHCRFLPDTMQVMFDMDGGDGVLSEEWMVYEPATSDGQNFDVTITGLLMECTPYTIRERSGAASSYQVYSYSELEDAEHERRYIRPALEFDRTGTLC